jgi:RNA polymerase sigma factor (sigma-70 family)
LVLTAPPGAALRRELVEDLVERARAGDRDAFASLVGMISDRMYALAIRILRDGHLAEDALQGALLTAWRQLPTLRDPARFEAWVRRLLVHACYAEARRRTSWAANVRVLPVDGPAGPDDTISVGDRDALDRAFRRLSIEQRAVFVLHHHAGLALTEIAESLDIPAGTARSRLHYATRALRAAIEADALPVANPGRMA